MATYERQIDALGGKHEGTGEYNAGYADGYSAALDVAIPIGADADAVIDELVECIRDMLDGRTTVARWANDAETLVRRIASKEARHG